MTFKMPFIPSECYGPECEEDAYARGLCRPHYQRLVRYEARQKIQRFCEGPDCVFLLPPEFALNVKYCSEHCKNNARQQRKGLPLHKDQGPRSAGEKALRHAAKVIQRAEMLRVAKEMGLNLDDEDMDEDIDIDD